MPVAQAEIYGCPSCEGNFEATPVPTVCPLCGYIDSPNTPGSKGGFSIGGFATPSV